METHFYAAMLVPPFAPGTEWAGRLADSLLHPEFPIFTWDNALGRRLRRNYLWLLGLFTVSWITKVALPQTLPRMEPSSCGTPASAVWMAAGLWAACFLSTA
jgi:uncharacterized membrane protein